MKSLDQLQCPPVFIMGAARSGTTWTLDICEAHPQIATLSETRLFTPDAFGVFFKATQKYPSKEKPINFGFGSVFTREEIFEICQNTLLKKFAQTLKPHHRFLVEKTPDHIYHVPLILEIIPDARFIYIIRDGRDVGVSAKLASRSWIPQWRTGFVKDVPTHAKSWKDSVLTGLKYKQELGEQNFLEIRYEALRQNPFEHYAKIFDFIGAPYDDTLLKNVHDKTDFEKNFIPNEQAKTRGGRIGDWKRQMNLIERYQFHKATGYMLHRLGYSQTRWWWLTKSDTRPKQLLKRWLGRTSSDTQPK